MVTLCFILSSFTNFGGNSGQRVRKKAAKYNMNQTLIRGYPISCDQQLYRMLCWLVGWLVHINYPDFGDHSFHPRRLKFGMNLKCV